MKIKHYVYFNNKMKTLDSDPAYYIPHDKEDYLLKVNVKEPSKLTELILKELENKKLKKIFSIGSGIAFIEYQLKKFSNSSVVISDFNSTVLRLKKFEVFDDALILNALKDPLPLDNSFSVLFPRIDTEFDDNQFQKIFEKCHDSGVKHICFIPAKLLTLKVVLVQIRTLIMSLILRKPRVFGGYARSMSHFIKI
jgi:hypothetical protein